MIATKRRKFVICMQKSLLLPQSNSEFVYFLHCFNEWPGILKKDAASGE